MTEHSLRGGEQSFRSARIFDGTGPGGRPHVDRKMLDEGEAGRVLAYLDAAPVVHATDDYGHDRIDPGRGRSVPLTWQTDGTWVWPGAVSHYLRCYSLPPDPEFLAHIRKRGFQLPAVPPDARQAALAAVSSGPPDGMARRPATPPPAGRFAPRDAAAGAAGPAGAGAPGPAAGPAGAGLGVGAGPRTAAAGPPVGHNGLAAPPSRLLAGAHQDVAGLAPGNPGPQPTPPSQGPAGNGSQGGPPPLAARPTTRFPDPVGASPTVSLGASAVANGLPGTPNAASNGSRPPASGSITPEHDRGPARATGSRDAGARDAGKTADEPASRGFSTIAAALGAPGPQPPAAADAGPRAAGSPALRVAASRAATNTVSSPDGAPTEVAARRPDSVFTPARTPATATNLQPAPGYGTGGSTTPPSTQPPAVTATEATAPAAIGAGNPPAAAAGSPRRSGSPADRGTTPAPAAGLFGPAPASTPPVAAFSRAQPASGGSQHSPAPRARLGRGDQAAGGPPSGDRGAGGRSLGEPWSGRAGTPHGGPEPASRPHRPAGGPPHAAPTRPSGRGTAYRTIAEAPADDSSIFDRLRAVAVELGLSTRAYRVGAAAEGSWSVLREDSGWAVFRTEHGVRHDLAAFPNSLQAAAYLIGQLYLARDVAGAAAPARRATAGFDQETGTRNEPRHRPGAAVAGPPTGADAGRSGNRAGGPSTQDAGLAPVTGWVAGAARLGTTPADLDSPNHPTRAGSTAGPRLVDDSAREPASTGDSIAGGTPGPGGPSRPAADEPASTGTTSTRVVGEDEGADLARGRSDAAALLAPAIEPAEASDLGQDLSAGDGGALATTKPDGPAGPVAASRPAPTGFDGPPARRTTSREPDLGSAAVAADVRTTGNAGLPIFQLTGSATAAAEPLPRPSSSAASTDPTPGYDKPVKASLPTLAAGPAAALAGSRPDDDSPDAPAISSQADTPLTLGGREKPTAPTGLDAGSSAAGYSPSPAGPPTPQVGTRASAASASSLVTPRRTATPTSSGAATSHHAASDEHPWASPAAVPAARPPASTPPNAPQADRPARRTAGDAAAPSSAPAPRPDASTLRAQEPLRDGTKDSTSDSSQQSPAQWKIRPMPGEPPLTLYRDKRMVLLPVGTELDRYGDSSGNVTYAVRTPYPQRSLPTDWNELPYHAYRLRRPVEALSGLAVPWFEQPGGGPVFVLASSVADLVAEGSLVEIEGAAPPA